MVSFDEFESMVLEISETFPEVFFRDLNGGVMVNEGSRLHPAAEDHDLFVMGEYRIDRYLGRFIVLYYGSFKRCFGHYSEEELRQQAEKVLKHEFRHHLESLAGEYELEIEDAVEISQYKYRKQLEKDLTDNDSGDKIEKVSF